MTHGFPGFAAFSWAGKPIADIEAWAHARGEQMVTVRETRKGYVIASDGAHLTEDVETYDVPESFWNGMCASDGRMTRVEISRRSPRIE